MQKTQLQGGEGFVEGKSMNGTGGTDLRCGVPSDEKLIQVMRPFEMCLKGQTDEFNFDG